jgi:integrase
MMASKRNRGTSWEFSIKRKGLLPKPITLTFDTEAEGDAYCAHLEKLLDAGIVPDEFKTRAKAMTTLAIAITAYMAAVHITPDDVGLLNVLVRDLGTRPLDRVNYLWAEQWVQALQVSGSAPSTIRKKVGALARCLDWVVRRSDTMLVANPLRMLPKRYATTATGRRDVERDRRLQDNEEARILAVLNREKPDGRQRALALPDADALRLMFVLALETAMRLREMYTLAIGQIDLTKRTIFLDKTKNGSKRQVPMSSVAVSVVKDYLTTHHIDDAVNPILLMPLWDGADASLIYTSNKLSSQWSRIFAAAGCADLHFHDLRHEAVSRLFERTNLSDIEIAKISGHSSTKMLMRYANLRGSDLAGRMW